MGNKYIANTSFKCVSKTQPIGFIGKNLKKLEQENITFFASSEQ